MTRTFCRVIHHAAAAIVNLLASGKSLTNRLIDAAANMKRVLQIFRDGKSEECYLNEPLLDGEQGNYQTLRRMAEIVQADRLQPDLRRFVLREIVGHVAGHDKLGEVQAIFEYARDRITYRQDPWNVERIADLWSTFNALNTNPPYEPEGDCGIKSTFIATCCALLGYRSYFVIIKQTPNQDSFNHVYAAVKVDGELWPLDATPEDAPMGWEAASYKKMLFDIFA